MSHSIDAPGTGLGDAPAGAGTGTLNYIPLWTPDGNTLGNSTLSQNGSNIESTSDDFYFGNGNAAGGSADLRFYNDGTYHADFQFRSTNQDYVIFEMADRTASGNEFYFYQSGNSGNNSYRVILDTENLSGDRSGVQFTDQGSGKLALYTGDGSADTLLATEGTGTKTGEIVNTPFTIVDNEHLKNTTADWSITNSTLTGNKPDGEGLRIISGATPQVYLFAGGEEIIGGYESGGIKIFQLYSENSYNATFTLTNLTANKRYSYPDLGQTTEGAIISVWYQGTTTDITADNTVVTVDGTYMKFTSDSATASARSFRLATTGAKVGQEVTLEWDEDVSTGAGQIDSGSIAMRLAGTWTPTQYDTLTLKFNGTHWVETSRSANA